MIAAHVRCLLFPACLPSGGGPHTWYRACGLCRHIARFAYVVAGLQYWPDAQSGSDGQARYNIWDQEDGGEFAFLYLATATVDRFP